MSSYNNFKYIYPPRPENKISIDYLNRFDNNEYIAQPKLNGSCVVIFIKGKKECKIYNRYGRTISRFKIDNDSICSLNDTNNWMVLTGEYMNKNKKDEKELSWNNKLVIWDILVYDNDYLVNSTYEERVILMDKIFKEISYNKYLYKINDDVYRVKSFKDKFKDIYEGIVSIDLMEGLVIKKKNSKLEIGTRQKNNVNNQLKIRKPTKNYTF